MAPRPGTPTKQKLIDLDVAIGRNLRVIREKAGVPRELLVLAAQRVGIPWSVATLTLIESGRRRLTTGELFLLPHVLTTCIPTAEHSFGMHDLIPVSLPDDTQLAITPDCQAYTEWLRQLILSDGVRTEEFETRFGSMCTTRRDREQPHYDEVTLRAAHALRVPVQTIALAAITLWEGRTFIEERDERLRSRATEDASPRYIQAVRGHIARELMQELRDYLKKQKGGHRPTKGRKTS
jgi:hypothetical protein